MSSTNQARNSATDQIVNPAIKAAVEAAIEEDENDDDVEDSDNYSVYVAKSAAARDKSIEAWKTRAIKSMAKRLQAYTVARESRHQVRVSNWALGHSGSITAENAVLLEDALESQIAAGEAKIAAMRAKQSELLKLHPEVAAEVVVETELEDEVETVDGEANAA